MRGAGFEPERDGRSHPFALRLAGFESALLSRSLRSLDARGRIRTDGPLRDSVLSAAPLAWLGYPRAAVRTAVAEKYLSLPPGTVPDALDEALEVGRRLDVADLLADPQFARVDHPGADAAAAVAEGVGDARLVGDVLDVPTRRPRAGALERRRPEPEPTLQQVVDVAAADDQVPPVPAVREVDSGGLPYLLQRRRLHQGHLADVERRVVAPPGAVAVAGQPALDGLDGLARLHRLAFGLGDENPLETHTGSRGGRHKVPPTI